MKNLFNKIFSYIVLGFFLIMLLSVGYKMYLNAFKEESKQKIYPKYYVDNKKNNDSLTLDNVYQELINQGIRYPDIIICQVILETNYLKSYNCRTRNNLFGFYNGKRYLKFDNWKQCVAFKRVWQEKYYKNDKQPYYKFLTNLPYAEDLEYVAKLKQIKYEKDS